MNENLKSLIERAGAEVKTFGDGKHYVNVTHLDPVKFAELIVEDCIRELHDAYDMTMEEGNYLKDYFGFGDE